MPLNSGPLHIFTIESFLRRPFEYCVDAYLFIKDPNHPNGWVGIVSLLNFWQLIHILYVYIHSYIYKHIYIVVLKLQETMSSIILYSL